MIRRIHVRLHLRAAEMHRATAERVHGFFASRCPVYRSLEAAIAITTELVFEPLEDVEEAVDIMKGQRKAG